MVRYDPYYTWNRGGRLKELRIRNLARKYAYIWREKIWGNCSLTPSAVKRHLDEKRRIRLFLAWKRFWWEKNKEWKLNVRATIHYNHKVAENVLTRWSSFVKENKSFRNKECQAFQDSFHLKPENGSKAYTMRRFCVGSFFELKVFPSSELKLLFKMFCDIGFRVQQIKK